MSDVSSSPLVLPTIGAVSAETINSGRALWDRQFVPPKDASADAIAQAKGEHMARFENALKPVTTEYTPAIPDEAGLRAIGHLAEMGLSAGAVADLRTNGFTAVSQTEKEFAATWRAQRLRDPEWSKKFLSGDSSACGQMLACSVILSAPLAKLTPAEEQARLAAIKARA